ncbi:Uncharacterised protein [Yersinia frederiksenii]|nr:hypothetical protein CBW53_15935 [Yersinia frederiksenii]CNI99180.1 Uncharacterised protein [Yersinia frederiksenii]
MLSKEQLEKIANPVQADIGGTQSSIVTQMAIELLSLREQIAELKALEPIAWWLADKNCIAYYSECCIGDKGVMEDEANNYNDYADSEDDCIHVIPLFTAAKPVEG